MCFLAIFYRDGRFHGPAAREGALIPLAVSGPIVIGGTVAGALLLAWAMLRGEASEAAEERAEQDAAARAEQAAAAQADNDAATLADRERLTSP